ncbi:MAG TPA: NAD-dependent epimerase, partial [Microbacteriaceae bacterium]|nr:NAD-dependent epimerase [Microbacteriaceae bacterium]
RRLVCVSSSATDPRVRFHDTDGGFFFEKILKPIIIFTLGRTLYADMWRMERLLATSDLDWTIIRPSGLFQSASVTDYRVAEEVINGRFTSRNDLADFMLRQLDDDRYLRKAVAVATFSVQPSMLELIRNEALGSAAKR